MPVGGEIIEQNFLTTASSDKRKRFCQSPGYFYFPRSTVNTQGSKRTSFVKNDMTMSKMSTKRPFSKKAVVKLQVNSGKAEMMHLCVSQKKKEEETQNNLNSI